MQDPNFNMPEWMKKAGSAVGKTAGSFMGGMAGKEGGGGGIV